MVKASRARRRRELRGLVGAGDIEGIVKWADGEREAGVMLVTRVFDLDDQKRWTAMMALGRVCREMRDVESVREILRRLLWLMNDESGGIAWHGPEAIAVIIVHVPELMPEFGRIVASFIHEDPFGPGAAWAISRLARVEPELFEELLPDLEEGVGSPDPFFRGSALEALAALRPPIAERRAKLLVEDQASLPVFDMSDGLVGQTTVGEIARRATGSPESAGKVATGT